MKIGQQQRLAAMRYFLYDRPIHPELFEIYDDVHLHRPGYEARIWVTGCTHVIQFYRDDSSLSEVICSDEDQIPLPTRGKQISWPFRGERAHEQKRLGGINYMMNFQAETLSPQAYRRTHHELARAGGKRGTLFVPFPMWMTQSLTPFTYISYEAKAEELHVMAFHAFPEVNALVKTQSLFELG